jgi:hypothetical protein
MNIPETKFVLEYLRQRGINPETALELGMEIFANGSRPRGDFRSRLGFDTWWNGKSLPDIVEEGIWVPHPDSEGKIKGYSLRVFPELEGKDGEIVKFLATKDVSFPFVPRATWDVAKKTNHPLFLTEGAIKAIAILQVGGLPIGLSGVWAAVRNEETSGTDLVPVLAEGFEWRFRKVYLVFDGDFDVNPSVRQALIRTAIVSHARSAEALIVRWPLDQGKGIDDYLAGKAGGSVELSKLFTEVYLAAVPLSGILKPIDLERVEMELSRSPLRGALLEQFCRLVSKPLCVRAGALLEGITNTRDRRAAVDPLQGVVVELPAIELWPEWVNGAEILDEIAERFLNYMVMPKAAADMFALWCTHTHMFDLFPISPRVFITSPDQECGKTTLRDCATRFCARAMSTDNMTTAVMFRLVAGHSATILADECDKWLFENEELVGLICSGHRKGGIVMRCEGDSNVLRQFGCYSPVLLAAITALPAQLHSRSIVVRLKRAKSDEIGKCTRFNPLDTEEEDELCRKLARWVADNRERIAACEPNLPEHLFNRIADNWRPLFAIARIAGGEWPRKCEDALFGLITRKDETDSLRVTLLADIQKVFTTEQLFSKDLCEKLLELKEQPWPEVRKGKGINERWLARNLLPFDVRPKNIRVKIPDGEIQAKGYELADFKEAFSRYLEGQTLASEKNLGEIHVSDPSHRPKIAETPGIEDHTKTESQILSVPKDALGTDKRPNENLHNSRDDKTLSNLGTVGTDKKGGIDQNFSKSSQSEPQGPQTGLGYMPVDEMLRAIKEVFPNAGNPVIITKPVPESDPKPPQILKPEPPQPELPF